MLRPVLLLEVFGRLQNLAKNSSSSMIISPLFSYSPARGWEGSGNEGPTWGAGRRGGQKEGSAGKARTQESEEGLAAQQRVDKA